MNAATRLPAYRDDKSGPFYDAAADGRLAIRGCANCHEALPPEAAVCTTCAGTDLRWLSSLGTGSLIAWTRVHRAPNRLYGDLVPYIVGLIELDEGPWLYGCLVASEPRLGMCVRAEFPFASEGDAYPVFYEEL